MIGCGQRDRYLPRLLHDMRIWDAIGRQLLGRDIYAPVSNPLATPICGRLRCYNVSVYPVKPDYTCGDFCRSSSHSSKLTGCKVIVCGMRSRARQFREMAPDLSGGFSSGLDDPIEQGASYNCFISTISFVSYAVLLNFFAGSMPGRKRALPEHRSFNPESFHVRAL
jgi:hypothetical protein